MCTTSTDHWKKFLALHVNDVASKTFSLKALSYFQLTNNFTLKAKYHLKRRIPKEEKSYSYLLPDWKAETSPERAAKSTANFSSPPFFH